MRPRNRAATASSARYELVSTSARPAERPQSAATSSPTRSRASGSGQVGERARERTGGLVGRMSQPPLPRRRRDRREQPLPGPLDAVERAGGRRNVRLPARTIDVPEQAVERAARDPAAEPARRGFL